MTTAPKSISYACVHGVVRSGSASAVTRDAYTSEIIATIVADEALHDQYFSLYFVSVPLAALLFLPIPDTVDTVAVRVAFVAGVAPTAVFLSPHIGDRLALRGYRLDRELGGITR